MAVNRLPSTWEINCATLTGAIDVIAVEQPNGDIKCSPIFVRFSKFDVFIAAPHTKVELYVNGQLSDLCMILAGDGFAYFLAKAVENHQLDTQRNGNLDHTYNVDLQDATLSVPLEIEKCLCNPRGLVDEAHNIAILPASYGLKNVRLTKALTSEQLKALSLIEGINDLTFSITTKMQGTARTSCCLYFWKHSTKLVVSDIDGTITKSDVLGLIVPILPVFSSEYVHEGVVNLFNRLAENGYKILYLSDRWIGLSNFSRSYLRKAKLPQGPVLLAPNSWLTSFYREIISRTPEEFKMQTLIDIKSLFLDNPFVAGFGNTKNDFVAYQGVGISMIFNIDGSGNVSFDHAEKSYTKTFKSLVHEVFDIFRHLSRAEEAS